MNVLIGPAALAVRVGLHWVAGAAATLAGVNYAQKDGVLTIDIETASSAAVALIVPAVTDLWRRYAKNRGGRT